MADRASWNRARLAMGDPQALRVNELHGPTYSDVTWAVSAIVQRGYGDRTCRDGCGFFECACPPPTEGTARWARQQIGAGHDIVCIECPKDCSVHVGAMWRMRSDKFETVGGLGWHHHASWTFTGRCNPFVGEWPWHRFAIFTETTDELEADNKQHEGNAAWARERLLAGDAVCASTYGMSYRVRNGDLCYLSAVGINNWHQSAGTIDEWLSESSDATFILRKDVPA